MAKKEDKDVDWVKNYLITLKISANNLNFVRK